MPIAPGARSLEYSTVAYAAGVGLGAAVEYLLDLGIDRGWSHGLRLTERLDEGLRSPGAELVSPTEPDRRGTMSCARFAGHHARDLAARLAEAGEFTSPRLGAVRFAPHVYNDDRDVDRALEVLSTILRHP